MIINPSLVVIAPLAVFAAITLVSAIAMRSTRRKLLALVSEIVGEGRLTKADRAWLRFEVEKSKGTHLLVASAFAPGAILGAIVVGAYEGWMAKHRGKSDEPHLDELRSSIDKTRGSIANLEAKFIKEHAGVDPREGLYWNDPRREQIGDLASALESWNNPIAMSWIIVWMVISLPALGVGYLIAGSLQPIVKNVWEPLRLPIMAIVDHLNGPHSARGAG